MNYKCKRMGRGVVWGLAGMLAFHATMALAADPPTVPATQPVAAAAWGQEAPANYLRKAWRTDEEAFAKVDGVLAGLDLTGEESTQIAAIKTDFAARRWTWWTENQEKLNDLVGRLSAPNSEGRKGGAQILRAARKQMIDGKPQVKETLVAIWTALSVDQASRFDLTMLDEDASVNEGGKPRKNH